MRLSILDCGHGLADRALFALIRAASGQPVLDVIKLVRYRADFYGKPMGAITHEAMRGRSVWSVGDRELMAALVAKTSACEFCTRAHSAVATRAQGSDRAVCAALSDLDAAPIGEPLKVTLRLLEKLSREHTISEEDVRAVLAAGASREQIEDALAVSFAFETITRLADAFAFAVPGPEAFEAGAKYLLARGYR
jgi:AhpD family alkylhydroperoxidase